ncbi:MAG: autotransporter-associated beta strand repeat-containing protein, partial [Bacteroidetes bacterium]|nr:autotransporter-associated beta strand repeat-containing protein [Bacteroidota bacterium]
MLELLLDRFRNRFRFKAPHVLFASILLFIATHTATAQTTAWNGLGGDGVWTTAANWTNGVPGVGASVTIDASFGTITGVPAITLNSLTITGTGTLAFGSDVNPRLITITGTLTIPSGATLLLGQPSLRFNVLLTSSASGFINGTLTINCATPIRSFQNDGNLTIGPTGIVNQGSFAANFVLSPNATLQIGSPQGIVTGGGSGNIQVTGGGTSYSTSANYVYNGTGAQNVGSALPATVNSLTSNNTTTVSLANSVVVTNALIVNAGTFNLGTRNVTAGSVNLTGSTISGTGTITLNGDITTNANATTAAISAPIALNGANRNFNVALGGSNPDLSVSSIISGGNSITKLGAGILNISNGGNTYSGGTSISAGTLVMGAASPLGTGSVTVTAGATLDLNGNNLTNTLSLAGTGVAGGALQNSGAAATCSGLLSLGGNATILANAGAINITNVGTITGSGNNLTLDGNAGGSVASIIGTGAGSVTKSGTGTWTLSGASTFTGGVTLNSGTLNINNSSALGSSAGTFTINGGTIDNTTAGTINLTNYPQQWNGDFIFNGTRNLNLGNGNVTVTANRNISVNANTLTVGGVVSAGSYNLTKSGAGTLAFAAGDVTVNNLNVNAGTLIAPTGNLNIAGIFTNSGTFNNNNGTVNYNGSTAQPIAQVTYYNLTCSGSGTKNATGNLTVSNALTNTVVLDMGANTLSYGSVNNTGGTIRFSGTNGLAINSGTVEYYGSSQTITSGTYNNLTITQSSGNALLNAATTINGTLTINSGNLVLGANNLLLGSSASVSIVAPSASRMIVASGLGQVIKAYGSTGPFTFPIGDAGPNYSPITVNVTSGAPTNINVSVVASKHPNNSSTTNYLKRYWNVTSSAASVATISANYVGTDVNGAETSTGSAQLNGTFNQNTNPWIKYVALGGSTLTASNASLTAGQTSAFTGITLANPSVSISGATPICTGGAGIMITANPVGDATFVYAWAPAAGLSSTSVANPTANPLTTTTYTVTVKDGNGIAATANAIITVNMPPSITTQPVNQTVCQGSGVTFSVAGTGTGLTYQWRKNTVNIGGATSSSYSILSTVAGDAANYDVVVSGTCAPAVTSSVATLTVNVLPQITSSPSNSTICETTNTSFTVNAGSTTSPTYQWQVSTDGGATFNNVSGGVYSGSATATLSLTGVPYGYSGYQYRAVVGGACTPTVNSSPATLTVQQNAVVSVGPTNVTACQGATVTFSVTASGSNLSYQWQENGVNLTNTGIYSGVSTGTLTLTGITLALSGNKYQVVVNNGSGACSATVTSAFATLTVNKIPDAAATDVIICSGASTNIAITNPNATPGTTFTWTVQSSTNVTGASAGAGVLINQSLTSTDGINIGSVTYSIIPQAAGCAGIPFAVNATVNPIPQVSAQANVAFCPGASINIPLVATIAGSTVSWTNTNIAIGIPASGLGNLVFSGGSNVTGADVIGTITYQASKNGCTGTTKNFNLTIHPSPVVAA